MPTRRPHAVRTRARNRSTSRRVRAALAGLATLALVGVTTVLVGAPAAARTEPSASTDPSTTGEPSGPPIGPATAGTEVCRVNDPNLDEVTGMVASGDVIYAVEGGSTSQPLSVEIWTINATTCAATSQSYGFTPIDPQDLALGSDGALWVADTGPGFTTRSWATMERVDLATGADAVPYRTLFPPDGAVNGTAVLLEQDNRPIIIASAGQSATLYRPDGPLPAATTEGLPTLQPVGQFTPVNTDTPTPRNAFGRFIVTGAAMAPDRSKVVIRTESDAYEFVVTGDDIVASITQGTPTITPLPNEENGLAITYSADGSQFLTLSSTPNPVLRAYTPYTPPAPDPGGGGAPTGGGGGSGLSFSDITTIALITGFLGLAAVVAGVIGIVRARRQYYEEHPDGRAPGRGPRPRSGSRDRRAPRPGRRDPDDDGEEYGASRPAWPPRPRGDDGWSDEGAVPHPGRAPAHVGADDDGYGHAPRPPAEPAYGGSTYGPAGAAPDGGRVYGSGGTTYGSGSGTTYGSASGGTTYGSGGTTYGSGGSGGTTYGSGGTTYGAPGGSGGTTYGSGRGGERPGGGVYGRPRSDRDDDDPRRPYGRDNIDL